MNHPSVIASDPLLDYTEKCGLDFRNYSALQLDFSSVCAATLNNVPILASVTNDLNFQMHYLFIGRNSFQELRKLKYRGRFSLSNVQHFSKILTYLQKEQRSLGKANRTCFARMSNVSGRKLKVLHTLHTDSGSKNTGKEGEK